LEQPSGAFASSGSGIRNSIGSIGCKLLGRHRHRSRLPPLLPLLPLLLLLLLDMDASPVRVLLLVARLCDSDQTYVVAGNIEKTLFLFILFLCFVVFVFGFGFVYEKGRKGKGIT
jgi:hypothetical protein